jgi:preprotein translocase subunit SecB
MKIKKSPLILRQFDILNSSLKYFQPGERPSDISNLFDDYDVDIDFAFHHAKDNEGAQIIFIKTEINKIDVPLFGYSISVEAVGVFSRNVDEIEEEEYLKMLQYSGVSILINCLRNFVSSLTSHGPIGPYLIPAIDLNDLILQNLNKPKQVTSETSKKANDKSTKK